MSMLRNWSKVNGEVPRARKVEEALSNVYSQPHDTYESITRVEGSFVSRKAWVGSSQGLPCTKVVYF
jgi:hypothetical protein